MKAVQFLVDFFAVDGSGNRFVKYGQGQTYPFDEETASQVEAGFAKLVQVKASALAKAVPVAEAPTPDAGDGVAQGIAPGDATAADSPAADAPAGEAAPAA